MPVKKVETFKAGHFPFSSNFDQKGLEGKFIEARVLQETVAGLPILPKMAANLEEETIRKSIFGTAALEGNPLSEDEVGQILKDEDRKEIEDRAETEIRNLKKAYTACGTLRPGDQQALIDEKLIKAIHHTLTKNITYDINRPGLYRDSLVKVGNKDHGGVYTPPKILDDIKTLMGEFTDWINSPELLEFQPPVRAALAHFHLGLIHPFGDGNGRMARLIEALILQSQGIRHVPLMMSNYYYEHIDDYYWAFSLARKNKAHDVTPFIEFVMTAFIQGLYSLKENITYFIRKYALKDYLSFMRERKSITKRQYELLSMLLIRPAPFTLKDLFSKSPFNVLYENLSDSTVRRDMARLTGLKLLLRRKDGSYDFNMRVLDDN